MSIGYEAAVSVWNACRWQEYLNLVKYACSKTHPTEVSALAQGMLGLSAQAWVERSYDLHAGTD